MNRIDRIHFKNKLSFVKLNLLPDLFVVTIVLCFVFIPWPHFFLSEVNLLEYLTPPGKNHPLGTDNLGRDLLVRFSGVFREAVLPIWMVVILANLLGVLAGAALCCLTELNYVWRYAVSLSFVTLTLISSVPIFIYAFLIAVIFASNSLQSVLFCLFLYFFVTSMLQIRMLYRRDEGLSYWQSNRAQGGSLSRRIFRYGVFSHWQESIFDLVTFSLAVGLTVESSLSFLGFGVQEPQASFGNMLASHFDRFLKGDLYILVLIILFFVIAYRCPRALVRICRKIFIH